MIRHGLRFQAAFPHGARFEENSEAEVARPMFIGENNREAQIKAHVSQGRVRDNKVLLLACQRQRRNIITSIKEGEYLTGHESIAAAVD